MKLALAVLACALVGAAATAAAAATTQQHFGGVHFGRRDTRPGTPCAPACEADPGAEACATCCRAVRHEVDWGCAASGGLGGGPTAGRKLARSRFAFCGALFLDWTPCSAAPRGVCRRPFS